MVRPGLADGCPAEAEIPNLKAQSRNRKSDGRSPNERGVWFIDKGKEIAALATAYPLAE